MLWLIPVGSALWDCALFCGYIHYTLYSDTLGEVDVITKEAYMLDRLKHVILWTTYIVVVLSALLFILAPASYALVMAVFLKKAEEISDTIVYISVIGVIGSVASLALGIFSIKQASDSSKQMQAMSDNVNYIKQATDRKLNNITVIPGNTEDRTWENEPQDEKLE